MDALRRQLSCSALPLDLPREKRYPYLDRDLLEFISAIPREQLVRPGQRRSLMRRALIDIVPDELLNRKRKAFVSRGPMVRIAAELPSLLELRQHFLIISLGIADSTRFVEALQRIREGADDPIVPLMRTLGIERWLRNLTPRHVMSNATWKTSAATKQALPKTDEASPISSHVT